MELPEVMEIELERLLNSAGQVRRLARGIAGSPSRGEDLAQEAWVSMLERPPAQGVPLLPWITGVVRNLARQERRTEARRQARERLVARSMDTADCETTERLEAQKAVVEAVRSLREPYRSVVVMRYFDGLTPRQIAARTQTPVRTVHTRLTRALACLRERLDREHGSRFSAWLPLMLMPASTGGVLNALPGALWMNVQTKMTVGALALIGLVAVSTPLWRGVTPTPQATPTDTTKTALLEAPQERPPVDAPPEHLERVAVQDSVPAAEPAAAAADFIEGRVVDFDGRPVEGLAVRLETEGGTASEPTLSDAAGNFRIEASEPNGTIRTVDERWRTVLEPILWGFGGPELAGENLLVVAPATQLAGRVVDESGSPLAKAAVEVRLPWSLRSRLPFVLDRARVVSWTTVTDQAGEFELDAAAVPEAYLHSRLRGYVSDVRALPGHTNLDLEIVLQDAAHSTNHLHGRVVDEAGLGVEDAYVALGFQNTTSGPDGSFALPVREGEEDTSLAALKAGFLPAFLERQGDSNTDPEAWPEPLVLTLGGPPLAIAGKLFDSGGDPVPNAAIELLDRTDFGAIEIPGQVGMSRAGFVEPLLRGEVDSKELKTDDAGRFRIEGLLPRAYRLGVFLQDRLLYQEYGPIEAGREGVVLALETEVLLEGVAGRVIGMSGDPIANLRIVPMRERSSPGKTPFDRFVSGQGTSTDAEGRFSFERLPSGLSHFSVSGGAVGLGKTLPLPAGADLEQLELVVPLRCRLQIELSSPDRADEFALLDVEGSPLMVGVYHGDFAFSNERGQLSQGRSEIVSVGEDARTVVLYSGGQEVERVPIELVPEDVNRLQL